MFNHILLAVDGSEHSFRATEVVLDIANNNTNTTIEIVYVIDNSKVKSEVLSNWNGKDLEKERNDKIDKIVSLIRENRFPYKVYFLRGDPADRIIQHSIERTFDLIVLGSRGLNTIQNLVLGSVSHKVLKKARCSTLIVR